MKKFNNVENVCTKTQDGKTVFLSRSMAVCVPIIAVIINKDKDTSGVYVLMSKRGQACPDFKGHWNLVCGYLDHNETLVDAAKREVYEETGFDVDSIPEKNVHYSIDQMPWAIGDSEFDNRQNVTMRFGMIFNVENLDDLPDLHNRNCETDEVDEVMWMDLHNVLEMKNSKDEFNLDVDKVWAFNHNEVIVDFVNTSYSKVI